MVRPFDLEKIMKKYSIWQKTAVIICPLISAVLLYFLAGYIASHFMLPGCMTYQFLGIYCPGCGMTRSVIALLHGDVLLSLRQNAFVIFAIIVAVVLYIRFALRFFGVQLKPLKLSKKAIYLFLIAAALYSVLRNFIPAIAPI